MSKRILILFFIYINCLPAFSQEKDQYVILISLDGYRYDYTERFEPNNIQQFIQKGVEASSLIPSFPSKTFPNHYSIATGLKPENHGLVDNRFYDPELDAIYSIGNREAVENPAWYGGLPIWVLAEQHGLTAASYFFVGTEAPVKGIQPSYYYTYDAEVSNLSRISKVFEWLELPVEERPRLITLYFSDMDDVGHAYGPDNDAKLSERIHALDAQLGALFEGVKSFDLDINIIIVSDHGMTNVKLNHLINLDSIILDLPVEVMNNGALAHIHLENKRQKRKILNTLKKKENNFKVVDIESRTEYVNIETYRERLGDLLILPDLGYYLVDTGGMINYQKRGALFKTEVFGEHGYHPSYRDMHGIFYANGPALNKNQKIGPIHNVDVYPLICRILNLPIPDNIDGEVERVKGLLSK
jgi:predicted AlkP superfamily pyrophosphatase or phosphodiesterase